MASEVRKRKFIICSAYKKKLSRVAFQKMSDLYDKLCNKADLILKEYNPCNIENGRCFAGYPCCQDCEFLSKKKGCTVDSLVCKLWLCDKARKKFPKCATKLDALEKIAKRNPYLPLGERSIKEDVFSHYEIKK